MLYNNSRFNHAVPIFPITIQSVHLMDQYTGVATNKVHQNYYTYNHGLELCTSVNVLN